jgi:hypothetical protein
VEFSDFLSALPLAKQQPNLLSVVSFLNGILENFGDFKCRLLDSHGRQDAITTVSTSPFQLH